MYRELLIAAALTTAAYCLIVFIRRMALYRQPGPCQSKPEISLMFLVRNQEDAIEGLVRKVLADAYSQIVELVIVDLGSTDQTRMILKRLAGNSQMLKFIPFCEGQTTSKRIRNLCHGKTIYCFDLTSTINYGLMVQTIHSIVNGSKTSLYRTKILYNDLKLKL